MSPQKWKFNCIKRGATVAAPLYSVVLRVVLFQNLVDLGLRLIDLVVEVLCGDTLGPVAEDDELLKIVARRHAHAAAAAGHRGPE